MNKKNKIKNLFVNLGLSIVKTKNLLRFAFHHWITPFIALVLISLLMIVPSIISYNNLRSENITNNVLYLDTAISKTLNDDIKCHVKDAKLVCDENFSYDKLHTFENKNQDTIKYKVYVNTNVSNVSFTIGKFGEHFDTDNYIIFFETYFTYRYTYHDPKTETVNQSILYGSYDFLEGVDFSKIYSESLTKENPEQYLLDKANFIILDGYKGLAKEMVFTTSVSNIAMYLLFLAVISLLFKGNYLLKKQSFKYTQCFKISIIASIQSVLIALVFMLFGFNFINVLGFALSIRAIYIYIKYTGSRKNTSWIEEIYEETKNERFNLVAIDPIKVEVVDNKKSKKCPKCKTKLTINDDKGHCPNCNEDFDL